MNPVSLQWSLDQTAATIPRLVTAVSSDKIDPIALRICESFGAKLPLDGIVRRKLEMLKKCSPRQNTVNFLKSTFGYAKGDAVDYLLGSDGGIRFLSLTCALLCTSDTDFAATILHGLILETAPSSYRTSAQEDRLPTVSTFHRLLEVLEDKLCRVGFALEVAGYQRDLLDLYRLGIDEKRPSSGVIMALVQAFMATHRLGSGRSVEVRAYSGVPWIVALTKWMLGAPPAIYTAEGRALYDGSLSKTCVFINQDHGMHEEVKVMQSIDGPRVLWSGPVDAQECWSGMVTIQAYGELQLANMGLLAPDSKQALEEVLPYAISLANRKLHALNSSDFGIPFHPALGYKYYRRANANTDLADHRASVIGTKRQLSSVMASYLGRDAKSAHWREMGEEERFPELERFLDGLAETCGCHTCTHSSSACEDTRLGLTKHEKGSPTSLASLASSICGKAAQGKSIQERCAVLRYWAHVSLMTTEILALSLYDWTEGIQVYWRGGVSALSRIEDYFTSVVHESLFWTASVSFCHVRTILGFALSLVGHQVSREIKDGTWIASSFKGQAVYPLMFDLEGINAHPLLLGGGAGQLRLESQKIQKVVSRSVPQVETSDASTLDASVVTGLRSPDRNTSVLWKKSVRQLRPSRY
ncbi:hypothetical protein AAFC00_006715 [Neodothiora populina]|uniref:Uncharacterized protein n=1 Tax=Neodothiora populina TaxID=2781224 RepID=A0ABR3PAY0_9PEZI